MKNDLRHAPAGRAKLHYGYIIVACCCLIMGVDVGLLMSCAGIFYAPVSRSLGVSVGEFGIYMSCSFITSSLMLSVAGRMIERYSARWILTAASALGGVCLLAMSLFDAVWQFYIAGCLIGVSLAFLMYLSFPTLINRWFRTKVGLLIGICSAASGIGGVLFNPVGGWVMTQWGWRAAYAVFGLVILTAVTPLLAWLLRDYPHDKGLEPVGHIAPAADGKKAPAAQGVMYGAAVRTIVFYALMLFAFIIMAVSTLNLFIPKYVLTLDYTLEESAFAASAIMLGVTVGKLCLGYVNDRNCSAGVLVTTLSGAVGLAILIIGGQMLWLVLLGAFMFGWAYAGVTVQTAMLVRTVFGTVDYARIFAIISMALAAGGAIASGAWGFMAEHMSYPVVFEIGIAMLVTAAILGILALRRRA